jgi:hypothetical protein
MEPITIPSTLFAFILAIAIAAGLLVLLAFRKESLVFERLKCVHGGRGQDFGGFWCYRVSIWKVSRYLIGEGGKDDVLVNLVTSTRRLYRVAFCLFLLLILFFACISFLVSV